MNAPLAIAAAGAVGLVALLIGRSASASTPGRVALPFVFSEGAGQGGDVQQLTAQAPVPALNDDRRRRNVAAFLQMIRAAEGTLGQGG